MESEQNDFAWWFLGGVLTLGIALAVAYILLVYGGYTHVGSANIVGVQSTGEMGVKQLIILECRTKKGETFTGYLYRGEVTRNYLDNSDVGMAVDVLYHKIAEDGCYTEVVIVSDCIYYLGILFVLAVFDAVCIYKIYRSIKNNPLSKL